MNKPQMYNRCLNKTLKAISNKESLVICEEFDWDTCLDVVLELKSRGCLANTYWGDEVLCIRLEYCDE